MRLRIVHGGDSNGQRIVEDGKQCNGQKRNQLRSADLLGSGCLLRAARRMVWTAYRTRASSCVLLCRSPLRGGVRFAFHARNAQKRLRPRARHWSNRHILIRHRLAFGNRAIGRRYPYQLHRVCPYWVLERHKRSSTRTVSYVPCAKAGRFRNAYGNPRRLRRHFRFAIFACAGCPCSIPRLRCGVLPYEASLEAPSSRPLDNRFKAPSRKNRNVRQAGSWGDAPSGGSFDRAYCAVRLERCIIHGRFHPSSSHDQRLGAPRVHAFCGHRRNRLDAEPRAQPVRFSKSAFRNCATQLLSYFPWQRIQYVARSDFQHGLGGVARRSHTARIVRN